MSGIAKTIFRLNGQFLALGESLARPVGLTASWWQILGAVLDEPLSVADIARKIGVTRQSVQRVADILVVEELAEYRPNPAHRRAKLLHPTEHGRVTVRRITPAHAALAERLSKELGAEVLRTALDNLTQLSEAVEKLTTDDRAIGIRRNRGANSGG
ncbi:MAG: MarR family winged helix-turn-helix transcriptional regulator [Actinomycetota bacterium]